MPVRAAPLVGWTSAALLTGGLGWLGIALQPPPAPRWIITERVSAHHTLVLQVETRDLDRALDTARLIADPLRTGQSEILIYFHRPGRPDTLPPRRVQWTPAGGYVETVFD